MFEEKSQAEQMLLDMEEGFAKLDYTLMQIHSLYGKRVGDVHRELCDEAGDSAREALKLLRIDLFGEENDNQLEADIIS